MPPNERRVQMNKSVEDIVVLKIQDYFAERVKASNDDQNSTPELGELQQMVSMAIFSAVEESPRPAAENDYILINDRPNDECREVTMRPDGNKRKIDIVIGNLEDIKGWIESVFKVVFSKLDILAPDDLFVYWSDKAVLTKGHVRYLEDDGTSRFAHDESLVVSEAEVLAFAQDAFDSNRVSISKIL